jgi:hypothetical protein
MTSRYLGEWRLERSILDRGRDSALACHGVASLTRRDDSIVYEETVAYELDGKPIRATRTFNLSAFGGRIVATFSDGKPFFELQPDRWGEGAATHVCGADRYHLRLTLREPTSWATIWDVSGTKALRISTVYRR